MFVMKASNKPSLISFDLERELEHIEEWVYDGRRYTLRDLKKEETMLKQLAVDMIEIITNKKINEVHLKNLSTAIINGASGVWETAATNLQRLSYHFEEAKETIKELIYNSNAKTADRALTMLTDAFTFDELREILTNALARKSKLIRSRAANSAFLLKNTALIDILKKQLKIEVDEDVKKSLQFSIKNMSRLDKVLDE